MLHSSLDMVRNRFNYFSFWAITFCPFTSVTARKIKIKKKMKKTPGDIIILHKGTKNHGLCYAVPEICHVTDVIVIFHFGLFFAALRGVKEPKKSK